MILTVVVLINIPSCSGTKPRRTSIVVALADDLGFGDVEYNKPINDTSGARTPQLNDMARAENVMILSNFHSASSVCSPSRSSFLSGRMPDRECVGGPNDNFDKPGREYQDVFPFRKGMASIARFAKLAGYATGFFGKWHLGPIKSRNPGTMGFDTWIASAGNMPTYDPACLEREARCQAKRCRSPGDECFVYRRRRRGNECSSRFTARECYVGHYGHPWMFSRSWSPSMFQGFNASLPKVPKGATIPRRVMLSDFVVDQFEAFASAVNPEVPIFAYVWFHAPHHPFIASPELGRECLQGKICRRNYTTISKEVDYFGVVHALDGAIGRIRSILRALNRADDTLLIVTSDNGPLNRPGAGDSGGSAGPFRGYKGSIQEGAHRVVGLLEWPATIKENSKLDIVASSLDLFPTFLDVFKQENMTVNFSSLYARPSDGTSLLPLLKGNVSLEEWETTRKPFAMCEPLEYTIRYCQSFAYYYEGWKIVAGRKSVIRPSDLRLYNVTADPMELRNVAGENKSVIQAAYPQVIAWLRGVENEVRTHCKNVAFRNG